MKSFRLRALGALIFLAPFFALPAHAACTGCSPTWTSTIDEASVTTCVNNAHSGDTINVGAGTATWASSLNWSGKNINLIGAGMGVSIVTLSANINADTSTFRISGFTFNSGSYINASDCTGYRIDHNDFERTTWDIVILTYASRLSE